MSKNQKPKTLSWDAFQSLGNPENAPDLPEEKKLTKSDLNKAKMKIRVYLERKNRGGKTVSIVKGLDHHNDYISDIAKKLKSKCGVGGNAKNGEVVLQGDHRKKIVEELKKMGYTDVKNAGA